jgi:hypothetical protein
MKILKILHENVAKREKGKFPVKKTGKNKVRKSNNNNNMGRKRIMLKGAFV